MRRIDYGVLASVASLMLAATPVLGQTTEPKALLVSEPAHGIATLPFYISISKGFFLDEGLKVTMLSTDGGSAQTNAVLSGQAFAFVGGPEHNAFAKIRGAELRAIVNLNDRATAYFVAGKGKGPAPGQSMPEYIKGKSIAVGLFGGTPNSILRNMLGKWGLDPKVDVTLSEMAAAAGLAAVKSGGASIAVSSEPFVTQGIRGGVWEEPFLNVPKELGPYVYTTLNVRLSSIKEEPETVRKFVRAVVRGLKYTHDNHEEAVALAKKEFATMAEEDIRATLDRSFRDEAWSFDGLVSAQSWQTASRIVLEAGILKQPVPFDDVFDMQFVK